MSAQTKNYARTKLSCYFSYLSMATPFSLPPLLFVTFREMYGMSISLVPEQIGMKTGMLVAAVFPLLGTVLLVGMKKYFERK